MDGTAGGSTPGNPALLSLVTYYEKGRHALDIRPIDPPFLAPERGPPGAPRPVAALAALLPLLLVLGPSAAAQVEESRIGDFVYVRETAFRTGADRSYVFLADTVTRAGLRWKCTREGLRLQVVSAVRWLGGEPGVAYRIDDADRREPEAWKGGDGKLVYAPREIMSRLNADAADADSVHLLIRDHRGRELEASFGLAGFTKALRKLSCAR